jgi:soluble lytic murein transglycosylase
MLFKLIRRISLVSAVVSIATSGMAHADTAGDETLLAAYDAWRAGDAMKFARHAARLEGHALAPWLEYWRLSLRLEDASAADLQEFFAQHGNTYPGELLRLEWAKVLGKREAWQEFEREHAAVPRPDLEVRCQALHARLARGDEGAFAEAAQLWLHPDELPQGCERLAGELDRRGKLTITDVWQRVRVLFAEGHITAAKTALGYLPRSESPDERMLAEAARTPKRILERLPKDLERRPTREVVVLAAIRHARIDPAAVAAALEGPLDERLPEREVKVLWGRVAHEAARQHHEHALKWYARAGDTRLDEAQLAWKVRAALRRGHWKTVRAAIDRMSSAARMEPAWIYWYGRALAAAGDEAGARAYFLRIAGGTEFYSVLASEELGYVPALPIMTYVPTDEEMERIGRVAGLQRALALIRAGLRTEGVREWLFTLRSFDDTTLIAAAELARRAEVYDRAIQAADRTERLHNFSLRYPVPYRDVFESYARAQGLDEAWVFGLVRQESRFVTDARSSAGAAGLMQIMPRTARFIASKIGLRNFKPKSVTEVPTNVNLGTGYMKLVLEQLGHPVLASAAYNAGPARAKRWRDARPLEGAIYAETIPFSETRDYVKKVMANSVFYAALLDQPIVPIKSRLGTIPARAAGESIEDDDLE